MTTVCTVVGCFVPHYAKGLCSRHYQRQLKGLELVPVTRNEHNQKRCRTCLAWKDEDQFPKKAREQDGLDTQCKRCHSVRRQILSYGLTNESFLALVRSQGSTCAICHRVPLDGWCVDHDHRCCPGRKSCGKCVRGLLCRLCNAAIGMLADDPTLIRRAANYIEEYHVPHEVLSYS